MNGKLVQATVLLLEPKSRYGSMIGFNTIMYHIFRKTSLISFGNGDNGEARKQMEEVFHLVNIISCAGEALDKYIQAHSEVPQLSVYCSYSDMRPFHCILPLYHIYREHELCYCL